MSRPSSVSGSFRSFSGSSQAEQVHGFAHGERVRDRTGLLGRGRILELTDAERAQGCMEAEVVWDGLWVRDGLDVAIGNGLEPVG